ncbi:hypothetical protein ASG81_24855 [Paenibacillus sp. Soil522]|nr:hypothetical protein ASG81_24855 [Paenibacillus sp. Soil522]
MPMLAYTLVLTKLILQLRLPVSNTGNINCVHLGAHNKSKLQQVTQVSNDLNIISGRQAIRNRLITSAKVVQNGANACPLMLSV